jgi:branched-chain amino acid transport system substrate-binding protein
MQRIFDAVKAGTGKKYLVVVWPTSNPIPKLAQMKPERFGLEFVSTGGASLENLRNWKGIDVVGGTFYYYDFPKNPMNDWLVKEHQKRFNQPPDIFTAGGFVTAAAIIAGLKKANSTDTDKLIAAMEGLEFDTPKGKITFRKEDHQGMQDQYIFRVKKDPKNEWDVLSLVKVVPASAMNVPLKNKR